MLLGAVVLATAGGCLSDTGGDDGNRAEGVTARLVVNEVVAAPAEGGTDWVELYVMGTGAVALGGVTLIDQSPAHEPLALPHRELAAGEFLVVTAGDAAPGDGPHLGYGLGDTDSVTLARDGVVLDALSWTSGDAPRGASFGRLPDGVGATARLEPTPGAANVAWQAPAEQDGDPFPADRVIRVEIDLSAEAWDALRRDPLAEEYQRGDLTYDGVRVEDVGVRTKGNSSLSSVVHMGSIRYPLKVDTDRHVDGQTLRGVKKLNFSNGFKDPTCLREHLAYRVFREAGVPAPRTAFADLWVAGEHLGLYTVVEQVDKTFLADRFADDAGDLYKPEPPAGNLARLGGSAADYRGLEPKTNEGTTDHAAFLALVAALAGGDDAAVERSLDVTGALRYLAVNTALVNLDSYLGFGHNYYLYEIDGRFTIIPWDVNEAFGNFTCGCDRDGVLGLLVDEPVCGALADKPLVSRLLGVERWRDEYHDLLGGLLAGPLAPEAMEEPIRDAAMLVRPALEVDERRFHTMEEFDRGLNAGSAEGPKGATFGLRSFVADRAAAIRAQLSGERPADNGGRGSCGGGGGGPGTGGDPKCPDGVCDEFEAANPEVCPQDCGGAGEGEGEGPGPGPNPEKCPDGVCDEAEQRNPTLCPEDCR